MQFTMHFIKSHEIPPFTTIVADSCRFHNGIGGFCYDNAKCRLADLCGKWSRRLSFPTDYTLPGLPVQGGFSSLKVIFRQVGVSRESC